MPQAATVLAIGSVASVAGTLISYSGQRKAARAQQQQQQLATRRSQRQAIRQYQIQRAQAMASAQGSGTMASSGVAGGVGGLSSQLGESLGFSTQMSGLSQDINSGMSRASFGSGLANFGMMGVYYGLSRGATFKEAFSWTKPTSPAQATAGSSMNPLLNSQMRQV